MFRLGGESHIYVVSSSVFKALSTSSLENREVKQAARRTIEEIIEVTGRPA